MGVIKLQQLAKSEPVPQLVKTLYHDSFPADERRDWAEFRAFAGNPESRFAIMGIYVGERMVGFISYWQFDGFRYVEHFATDPSLRGAGIGGEAIRLFAADGEDPVVLEVEPPSDGEMARRRIGFYERQGFTLHAEFEYIQPPYSPDKSELPLLLMTAGGEVDLPYATRQIHRAVYGRIN